MNRENTLFAFVGLLLGYAVAFTLVVYLNQGQPPTRAVQAGSEGQLAEGAGGQQLPMNAVKDQEKLKSAAQQAALKAREEPESFESQVAAANAGVEAGDFEGAIDFLTRANKLKPEDYETLLMLGRANFEARRYEVAGRWYTEALQRKPDDSDARSELALTYYLRTPSDLTRAVSEFNTALAKNPGHEVTLHNLTLVYIETGKLPEAEATFAKLEKASPASERLPVLRERLKEARGKTASEPSAKDGVNAKQKKTPTD
jgi:cytochrome c-type biogenesis protein CcmH/NrfG